MVESRIVRVSYDDDIYALETNRDITKRKRHEDDNQHVQVGPEDYLVGAYGLLMPVRKGQAPPDLRHFK